MNLINIQNCLQNHQAQEAITFESLKSLKLMNIKWILQLNCQHLNIIKNLNLNKILQSNLTWIFWNQFEFFYFDFDFIQSYFDLISLTSKHSLCWIYIQILQEIIDSCQKSTVKFDLIFLCWRNFFWKILILF